MSAAMELSSDRLQRVEDQFKVLKEVLIDACSIINMNKCGFLDHLSRTLHLYAPEPIIVETGYPSLPIRTLGCTDFVASNDQCLVDIACDRGWPVISEDKKVLKQMASAGLPYFNAAMMLNLLSYRRMVTQQEYKDYLERLRRTARYSADVWRFAEAVHENLNISIKPAAGL